MVVFFASTGLANTLTMANDFISKTKWGDSLDAPVFGKGATVYYHAFVAGLKPKPDGKYSINTDMLLIAPNGRVFRWAPNIIINNNVDKSIFKNDLLPIQMSIEMEETYVDGDYTFIISFTDKVSGKKGAVSKRFTYKK